MFLLSQILFFSSYCLIFLIWHSILSLIQSKLIFPASSPPISWYMVFHFKLIYWVLFNFFSFFSFSLSFHTCSAPHTFVLLSPFLARSRYFFHFWVLSNNAPSWVSPSGITSFFFELLCSYPVFGSGFILLLVIVCKTI